MKITQETFDSFENGGLDDEDASAVRPSFPRTRGPKPQVRSHAHPDDRDLQRDYSRKNDVGNFHFPIISYLSPTLSACTRPPRKSASHSFHQGQGIITIIFPKFST